MQIVDGRLFIVNLPSTICNGSISLSLLTQLHQYSPRILWVEEADQFIVGAVFWDFVQQGEAFLAEAGHFGMDIGHFKSDMVDAFSFFFR